MQTTISISQGSALDMSEIPSRSVDLIVTSPPYPMIGMWDEVFAGQNQRIRELLDLKRGREAYALMHRLLDRAWFECDRVLRPGGIACINIGDATRTIDKDFQLYSNHSRILRFFLDQGYAALPDILWRKQTNAPNKFMGSGMLPVGAYVTFEHEYILILRKGKRREFLSEAEKRLRRESAFFWEERNVWFSDIWQDIKGTSQGLLDRKTRDRSGAFPFELAYRLICMFSVKGDRVLDPFAGTGTTLVAALASARNGLGVESDPQLVELGKEILKEAPRFAKTYIRNRLQKHHEFVAGRTLEKGPLKHTNIHYGFPVMTAQERELLLNEITKLHQEAKGRFSISYDREPGVCLAEETGGRSGNRMPWKNGTIKQGKNPKQQSQKTKELQLKLPFEES